MDNKKRDAKNYKHLRKSGWKVITIWECQIKNKIKQERTLNLVADKIIMPTASSEMFSKIGKKEII